jgi:flagellar basal body rod protein FlgB
MIQGMLNSGAIPALQRLVQFTGARHKVLTNNIANLSTPYFKPADLDTKAFQPSATNDNILFHDQNNRDLERTMQRLAENTLTHNAAIELLRSEFDMMRTAIRERF